MQQYKIGVDLGGTKIAVGLLNSDNKIIDTVSAPTNLPRPMDEVENSIADLCFQIALKNNIDFKNDIKWVGIGTPGSVNSELGIVHFNANFNYHNWQLEHNMHKLLNCKVYIENDANAAAYGEYIEGSAKNAKIAVAITLGTGIGGGIILNGKIYSGFNFCGAELGHIVIVKNGRECMCGRKGCWEKYASASALVQDTQIAMLKNKINVMWDIAENDILKVNAKTAFDGLRANDELAIKVVNNFIEYVACGITNVINIFQPEIICIGGGVSKEGDTLLKPLQAYVDKEDYSRNNAKRTKIVVAKLRNDAGIMGAACLGDQSNF